MLARTPSLASVFERGSKKFPWWPDWRGQTVAIVASGPSLRGADLSGLKGRCRVLAIKKSHELVPFADAVYGCDAPWWRHVVGLPKFNGLKFAFDPTVMTQFRDVKQVMIPDKRPKGGDRLFFDEPMSVGAGGNSGFQALNLVLQWGAARVSLFGFDAQEGGGVHWYGRNHWGMACNPDANCFKRWREAFDTAAAQCRSIGVPVINASPVSSITAFPQMTVQQAVAEISA